MPETGIERRIFPRYPIKVRVDFTSNDSTHSVFSFNMSAGGIFLTTHKPIPPGNMVVLQLHLPAVENTVEVLGEVVWNNIHPDGQMDFPEGMGIKFLNLNSLVTECLTGTFQARRAGKA